jgi:hypothetical protein
MGLMDGFLKRTLFPVRYVVEDGGGAGAAGGASGSGEGDGSAIRSCARTDSPLYYRRRENTFPSPLSASAGRAAVFRAS